MSAPRHQLSVTADRSTTRIEETLWRSVPLSLVVDLAADVDVSEAESLIFEIHSKADGDATTLLAREVLEGVSELTAPFTLDLSGRQMSFKVANTRPQRPVYGVLYALYLVPDEDSSDESSDSDDTNDPEIDVLAVFEFEIKRSHASPSAQPVAPLDAWLTQAAADLLYAPIGEIMDPVIRVIPTTLPQGNDSLTVTLRPGEAVLFASVQSSSGVFFVDCDDTGVVQFSAEAPDDLAVLVTVQRAPTSSVGLRIVDTLLLVGDDTTSVVLGANEAVLTASIQQAGTGIFFQSCDDTGVITFSAAAGADLPVKVVIQSPTS